MSIELTAEQRDLILALVNEALDEIGPEIHHTWTRDYKAELKVRRRELLNLQHMLAGQVDSPAEQISSEMIGTP